jgi:hypothetical protein
MARLDNHRCEASLIHRARLVMMRTPVSFRRRICFSRNLSEMGTHNKSSKLSAYLLPKSLRIETDKTVM